VLAGWASNSKYAMLGAVRSSAQMISYEVSVGLALIGPLIFARTLSMDGIVQSQTHMKIWLVAFQPLAFAIYFVGMLAETNRAPFDLPESESELVAGFHVEYSGFRRALFFMAEYTNIIITSAIAVTVFLGGWWIPGLGRASAFLADPAAYPAAYSIVYVLLSIGVFAAKIFVIVYVVMWIRWTLPRYRYDQLMDLGWKWMIPATLVNILLTAVFFVFALEWETSNGQKLLMAVTARGLDLTAYGVAFFVVAGLLTIGAAWLVLTRINRNTSDFNLHSQRQLQTSRRAERLARAAANTEA
jgi:NADH-quinone oxidoreductase subunit H